MDLLVKRDDLHTCRVDDTPPPTAGELAEGHVLLRIDRFGLTANNITYAVTGDRLRYWDFFPAPAGWGKVPAWGFADVIASRHPGVYPGERYYGYLPMATHLVVAPGHVGKSGFVDAAPHRATLPAVYNQYSRTSTDPGYELAHEDAQILLRPLFLTSFMLDDFLADAAFWQAKAVVISSASSKTAYALAFLLSRREGHPGIIGLTSRANVPFVESLGCYDRVVAYDEMATIPNDIPVVYADMAGSATVRSAVHHHFGEQLVYSAAVGASHWEDFKPTGDLPGAKPTFFFAPDRIKQRLADWGPGGIELRQADAWRAFVLPLGEWMQVVRLSGAAELQRVYLEMLDGRSRPDEGYVLSL
jgi:hypothetical protein